MSKLINVYEKLKQENEDTLYLFKSGIFYIFIGNDAKIVSKLLCLKLTNLNDNYQKCGFPQNSLEKYLNLLNCTSYDIKIIDSSKETSYNIKDFILNKELLDFLNTITSINEDELSVKDAYIFIETIKLKASKLLKEENLSWVM